MRQIVAQLSKNSFAEKSASRFAAANAAAKPPKSATFSETVSLPFTFAPYESKPSNWAIIFCVRSLKAA